MEPAPTHRHALSGARDFLLTAVLAVALAGCFCRTGSRCDKSVAQDDTPAARTAAAQAVFDTHCISCHAGTQAQGGLDLSAANRDARLIMQPSTACTGSDHELVTPGMPEQSYLIEKVSSAAPACGGQMPPGSQLSAGDIETLRAWIAGL